MGKRDFLCFIDDDTNEAELYKPTKRDTHADMNKLVPSSQLETKTNITNDLFIVIDVCAALAGSYFTVVYSVILDCSFE